MKRSSRSSANNSAEAYRKRRYPNHFISKGTDNNAENSDTEAAKGLFTGTETKTKVCSLKQIMYLRGHFRLTSGEIRVCCSNSKP
jgi:hypothetical protein